MSATAEDTIRSILERFPDPHRDDLIPALQEVQESQGYLSREAVMAIADHLGLSSSKVYGVATFYNQFRFQPLGKHHIQVCRGTACHVKGSGAVLDALKKNLNIEDGETSRDGLFSLEVVACIGACGLAPVISVNGEFHANLTPESAEELVDRIRKSEEKADV